MMLMIELAMLTNAEALAVTLITRLQNVATSTEPDPATVVQTRRHTLRRPAMTSSSQRPPGCTLCGCALAVMRLARHTALGPTESAADHFLVSTTPSTSVKPDATATAYMSPRKLKSIKGLRASFQRSSPARILI